MKVQIHEAAYFAVNMKTLSDKAFQFFLKNFGCARKVYNLYVDFLYQTLEKAGYKPGQDLPKVKLPEVKEFKEKYSYLKEVDSLGLSNAKLHFEEAMKRYQKEHDHKTYTKRARRRAESGKEPLSFRGLKGMPGFHAKARGYFSYTTNCQYPTEKNNLKNPTIRLEGNLLYLPKQKKAVELILHRPLPKGALIKNVTVSMDTCGQLHVSVNYEREIEMDVRIMDAARSKDSKAIDSLKFLGLDYSQPHFCVDSKGRKANYPKFYREAEEKLAKMQRKLSKMEEGSKHYEAQKKRVSRLHKKIVNQRKDFLHKLSTALVRKYDVIVVEDIDLRAMGECLSLGKNLHDNGFGMFRNFLSYKLERKGSVLVRVDKWYASTKTCSHCGYKNTDITLKTSEWTCPECGTHHGRDENAAVNIEKEGRRIFADFFEERMQERDEAEGRAQKRKAARKTKKKKAVA